MTHCFLLECCTKTHIDDYLRFVICIFFLFYVLISAFPLYFVAICQRLIYEYMDMDMELNFTLTFKTILPIHLLLDFKVNS